MERKVKKQNTEIKDKGNFIWYSLRVSFWLMIFLWVVSIVFSNFYESDIILTYLFIIAMMFTFVTSIIHLIKYREKVLAIVALVLSSLEVVVTLLIIGSSF